MRRCRGPYFNRTVLIYNVKPKVSGRGRRREVGRFRVRPPQEVQQYLDELLLLLTKIGPLEDLDEKYIRGNLSPNSPYSRNPFWSMQALGYLDAQRRILPKLRVFPAKMEHDETHSGWMRGKLKAKRLEGYGFILGDDGNEYYLHVSNLVPPIRWDDLTEGKDLLFKIGERHVPGKPRPAMQVKPG